MVLRAAQGWDVFVNNTGRVPDMVIFSCALWDLARHARLSLRPFRLVFGK